LGNGVGDRLRLLLLCPLQLSRCSHPQLIAEPSKYEAE
jgi:hypothetical protein